MRAIEAVHPSTKCLFNYVHVKHPSDRPVIGRSVLPVVHGDGFMRHPGVSFAGSQAAQKKGLIHKGLLWLTLLVSPAAVGMGHGTDPPKKLDNHQPAVTLKARAVKTSHTLTETDKTRYQNIESWFPYLETRNLDWATRQQGINQVQGYWNNLRNEAVNGNVASRKILHGLWVNRMYDELTRPATNLVRFNYNHYSELVNQRNNGKLTDAQFKTELQWRALKGLYCYYSDGEVNELTQDVSRLYDPVMKLLENNPNEDIQRWGGYLMSELFGKFTPDQQKRYLDKVGSRFLDLPHGADKLAMMNSINSLYWDSSTNPYWKTYAGKMVNALEDLQESTTAEDKAKQKYYITLLALMRNSDITAAAEPLAKPDAHPETQQAVAWSLGRVRSPKGLKILTGILENNAFHPLAQEMAIYSVTEYAKDFPEQVNRILQMYGPADSKAKAAPKAPNPVRDNVREAARVMRLMLSDRSDSERDFFINLLLETDAQKDEYRRLRNQYVIGFDRLDTQRKNMVDRALLPYRHHLQDIINKGGRHRILMTNVTEAPEYRNSYGIRIADGRLNENIHGMSSVSGAVTGKGSIIPGGMNTFSHEFIHHLHQLILNNQPGKTEEILRLFREQKALDYYAAWNEYEYLAQGGEAMESPYKNHYYLYNHYFFDGYHSVGSHTRSQLKRKDPALYDFLKSLRSIPLELSLHMLEDANPRLYALVKHQLDQNTGRDDMVHVA